MNDPEFVAPCHRDGPNTPDPVQPPTPAPATSHAAVRPPNPLRALHDAVGCCDEEWAAVHRRLADEFADRPAGDES